MNHQKRLPSGHLLSDRFDRNEPLGLGAGVAEDDAVGATGNPNEFGRVANAKFAGRVLKVDSKDNSIGTICVAGALWIKTDAALAIGSAQLAVDATGQAIQAAGGLEVDVRDVDVDGAQNLAYIEFGQG